MIIKQTYKNWVLKYREGTLEVQCILDGLLYSRLYDINLDFIVYKEFEDINFNGEYCYFTNYEDKFMVQVKLQDDSCLIIDKYNMSGSELLDVIGCHDFKEEIKE